MRLVAVRTLCVLLLGVSGGCSLLLDWDPEGLPCSSDKKECAEGYSCRVTKCVEKGTVQAGDTCTESEQCAGTLMCPADAGLFFCTSSCSSYYTSNECDSGYYCRPVDLPGVFGVCDHGSECTDEGGCGAGSVCVHLNSHTSICLPGCEITWSGVGTDIYSDNCDNTLSQPRYCQQLGATSYEKLVCMDASGGQADGSVCSLGIQPCKSGSICIGDLCRSFCNPDLGEFCEDGTICCSGRTAHVDFGYCSSDCD